MQTAGVHVDDPVGRIACDSRTAYCHVTRVCRYVYRAYDVLVLSGVCGVINSTFQYSAQSEKHFAFAARYYDLITDIDLELSKRRAFRTQADVFLTKIHMTFDALNNAAPHL